MVQAFARIALWLISPVSLACTAAVASANVAAPVIDLGYAKYEGYFDAQANLNITRFLGIRYAAPPLGQLRFQAPQSPVRESGVQPATQNPEVCYQAPQGTDTQLVSRTGQLKYPQESPVRDSGVQQNPEACYQVPIGTGAKTPLTSHGNNSTTPVASEDCLFLNVFVPGVFVPGTISANQPTARGLPVLVWIHGGGYQYGYTAQYDGTDLVADSLNGMVVVVIQYRLGVFGFLAGNEVQAHGALNAGLLDQNFALKWVQEYIGLFGGDKNRVTIWGESAGAGSVLQHIIANGGNTEPPLFHAAMVSSTYLPPQYYYNDRLPQSLYSEVLTLTGQVIIPLDVYGCASSANTFTCLQSVDAETLQAANYNLSVAAFYGTFIFIPVVDGAFILERPTMTLVKGRVNGQVLLAMSNQNEGNRFVAANEILQITDYISQIFPDLTPSQLGEAARIYEGYETANEQAIKVMGDSIFVCPTYYLLQTFVGRSWKGLFAVPPAHHGDDAIYYFNRQRAPPYNDPRFVAAFSESFMSLALYHDVNVKFDPGNVTPQWAMYDPGHTEMLFNRTEAGAPVVTPIETDPALLERCAFWSSVTSMTAQ